MADEEIPIMQVDRDEYRDSNGVNIPLCMAHELNPNKYMRRQAIGTLAGWSLCRDHMIRMASHIASGSTDAFIARQLLIGEF